MIGSPVVGASIHPFVPCSKSPLVTTSRQLNSGFGVAVGRSVGWRNMLGKNAGGSVGGRVGLRVGVVVRVRVGVRETRGVSVGSGVWVATGSHVAVGLLGVAVRVHVGVTEGTWTVGVRVCAWILSAHA